MTNKDSTDYTPSSGAALRIMGIGLDLDGISHNLGMTPSHIHRVGDLDMLRKPYLQDMWSLESPLDRTVPLETHLKWLKAALSPKYEFLMSLRDKAKVDIYCSFDVYREQNGLTLSAEVLKLFTELNIPLDISILALLPDEAQEATIKS